MTFREKVAAHLNSAMAIGVAVGLFLPGIDYIPKTFVLFLIAGLIFFACGNVTFDNLRSLSLRNILIFYTARFLILPVILYVISLRILPAFAPSILLLSLMPSGSAAPAIVNVLRGNIALSLVMTISTILLSPFIVPYAFWLAGKGGVIEIDAPAMFFTLCMVVFLPVLLYFTTLGRIKKTRTLIQQNSSWISVLLVGLLVALTVALRRNYFFENPGALFSSLMVLAVLYVVYYIFGWIVCGRFPKDERIAFTVSSGANNNSLAASLALLYFSPLEALVMIASELPWVLGVMAFRRFLKKL